MDWCGSKLNIKSLILSLVVNWPKAIISIWFQQVNPLAYLLLSYFCTIPSNFRRGKNSASCAKTYFPWFTIFLSENGIFFISNRHALKNLVKPHQEYNTTFLSLVYSPANVRFFYYEILTQILNIHIIKAISYTSIKKINKC